LTGNYVVVTVSESNNYTERCQSFNVACELEAHDNGNWAERLQSL